MIRIVRAAALISCLPLGACAAVNPRVTMTEARSPGDIVARRENLVTSFYLQGSRLDIALRPTAAPAPAAAQGGGGAGAGATSGPSGRARTGAGSTASAASGAATQAAQTSPQRTRPYELSVAHAAIEDTRRRFTLQTNSDLISRTRLVVAKRENTDIIQSIGSQVTDNRATLINNIAGIATRGIGLLVSGRDANSGGQGFDVRWSLLRAERPTTGWRREPELPAEPDPTSSSDPAANASETPAAATPAPPAVYRGREIWRHDDAGLNFRITVEPPPVTATLYDASLFGRSLNGIYHAACRRVRVEYVEAGINYRWEGVVADPNFLEFTPFPRQGKIEFHPQCGVSVTQEGDPTTTPDSLVNTAVTQAVAVITAIEEARGDDD